MTFSFNSLLSQSYQLELQIGGAMGVIDHWLYDKGLEPSEVVHHLHLALVASGMMLTPELQNDLLAALAQMDGKLHSTIAPRAVVEEFILSCKDIGERNGLAPTK